MLDNLRIRKLVVSSPAQVAGQLLEPLTSNRQLVGLAKIKHGHTTRLHLQPCDFIQEMHVSSLIFMIHLDAEICM